MSGTEDHGRGQQWRVHPRAVEAVFMSTLTGQQRARQVGKEQPRDQQPACSAMLEVAGSGKKLPHIVGVARMSPCDHHAAATAQPPGARPPNRHFAPKAEPGCEAARGFPPCDREETVRAEARSAKEKWSTAKCARVSCIRPRSARPPRTPVRRRPSARRTVLAAPGHARQQKP